MEKFLEQDGLAPRRFRRGDVLDGVVLQKGPDELLLDIGAKAEGLVSGDELDDGLGTFENLSLGDTVLATVTRGKSEGGLVVLSLKEAGGEVRLRELREAFDAGNSLRAAVRGFNKGGLVVAIGDGVEAFLPFSHLDLAHFSVSERGKALGGDKEREETLSYLVGEELSVKIIEFDPQNGRVVVSEKEALSETYRDQREKFWSGLKPGDAKSGVVVGVVPFGLFVRLEDTNVEGLVHISEISWEKVASPADIYHVGDEVEVLVLSFDPGRGRVSLSIKALQENPWERIKDKYTVGKDINGVVTKITPYGAFIKLEEGIEGLIHVSETVGPLEVGEEIAVRVVSFEPEKQRLGLSVRQVG